MIIMTFFSDLAPSQEEQIVKTIAVQVSEAKRHFSEYLARSGGGDCRVIIKRRTRPTAVLVSMDDLHELEQLGRREGLVALAGQWAGFDEIASDVLRARQERGEGRDVSL